MSRVAVVVPLRLDSIEVARGLIAKGPPFDLGDTPLEGHCIYLTDSEAVFVFDGPDARAVVEHIVGEADVWAAATEWRACLDGKPRVAEPIFSWTKPAAGPLHVPGF